MAISETLRLVVFYDIDENEPIRDQLARRDAEAQQAAAPGGLGGSGCGSGVRDLEFRFESESDRSAAKQRLQDAGFRFYHCDTCLSAEAF